VVTCTVLTICTRNMIIENITKTVGGKRG
jgi:hypothetical protein